MKKGHGHHGGAWKVAYADFVTAMMALFLVLWLTAQDEKIKEAVERAFRHPFSSLTETSSGVLPSQQEPFVRDQRGQFDKASPMEMEMLRRLNEELQKSLEDGQDANDPTVMIEMTSDGLKISVYDRSRRPVFEPQSVKFTDYGDWVFSTLAWAVARFRSFTVELEGHTERGLPPVGPGYDNWELSADRANAARRKLLEHGVVDAQIRKVAGYADTQSLPTAQPEDEVNRRVTVMLKIPEASKSTSG